MKREALVRDTISGVMPCMVVELITYAGGNRIQITLQTHDFLRLGCCYTLGALFHIGSVVTSCLPC